MARGRQGTARLGLDVVAGGRVGTGGAASTREREVRGASACGRLGARLRWRLWLVVGSGGDREVEARALVGWIGQGKIPRGIWKAAAGDGTHLLEF